MKLSSYVNFRLGLALVLTLSCTSSGCRSSTWKMPSWKMPGSKFFASRDPDPATLAGRNGVPELPESPATKYTASNIAAVGNSPAAPGTNSSTNSSLAGGTTYGYANPTATPPAGLAAQGNGYQTGPYQVGATGGLATGTTAGPTSSTLASGSNGLPNPYGGTYSGTASTGRAGGTNEHLYGNTASAGMPADIPLPNSVTSSLASGPNTTTTYPTGPGLPALPDTTSASYASTINPSPNMMPNAGLPPLPTGLPALPPPTGTAGSFEFTQPNTAGSFTLNAPNTATNVNNTPSTAYQGATTLGFAPGTTGRATTYNFSGSSSGSSPASHNSLAPPNTSLPPNTATLPNAQPSRF